MQALTNQNNPNQIATWSTERTSEQLQAFLRGKMTDIDLEDLDFSFDS